MEGILTRLGAVEDAFEQDPDQARARTEAFMAIIQDKLRLGLEVLVGWEKAQPMAQA